ncbi:hypothetical protein Calkr_2125 [Caldicellulosiruptor acetigenus I77R1B]|uniref:Uncharacterized protein n=1 Tax=Caldicellulosiruptor acetigenus (strain ATCC 700853 / DSM 12137 / I77R1B) TaxID=632335 RepID=E4S5T0_CALA7|nr:hypothetical protein [Caldicellulosiruptor acetigenus]ADQ41590.1 hypothetical protein Calkr_2125 [Caldicellulosiruptor acetigenus I77R1B]
MQGNQLAISEKQRLFYKAFVNTALSYQEGQNLQDVVKKLIFYGVKMINATPQKEITSFEQAKAEFNFADLIIQMISTITPKEFITIFPVKKNFKGHKYQTKDYFTTIEQLKKFDMDKPIGEKVIELLWDYVNDDITEFLVNYLLAASRLRKFEGKSSLAEEFAQQMGLKTYKLCQDNRGRNFLYDPETGKTTKVKFKVMHLKLIRGRKNC